MNAELVAVVASGAWVSIAAGWALWVLVSARQETIASERRIESQLGDIRGIVERRESQKVVLDLLHEERASTRAEREEWQTERRELLNRIKPEVTVYPPPANNDDDDDGVPALSDESYWLTKVDKNEFARMVDEPS